MEGNMKDDAPPSDIYWAAAIIIGYVAAYGAAALFVRHLMLSGGGT